MFELVPVPQGGASTFSKNKLGLVLLAVVAESDGNNPLSLIPCIRDGRSV